MPLKGQIPPQHGTASQPRDAGHPATPGMDQPVSSRFQDDHRCRTNQLSLPN